MGAPSAPSGGGTTQDSADAATGSPDPTPLNMARRFTLGLSLPQGRYEVRGRRVNNKNKTTSSADAAVWESCRAFMAADTSFGDVTLLAVSCRATSGVNNNTANKVNVIATRRLPSYNPETGKYDGPLKSTRSPIDAFADVVMSKYGGKIGDQFLDLVSLNALRTRLESLGNQNFDYVFDTRTTVWDALSAIARSVRCTATLNGSALTMIRDERDAPAVAVFTPDNIVAGSFQYQTKLTDIDENDGLMVTYLDAESWKLETVLCCAKNSAGAQIEYGNNPAQLTLSGVTDRDRAYKEGLYLRQATRLLRNTVSFSTGLDGYIPGISDVILVSWDVPTWGVSGLVSKFLTPDPLSEYAKIVTKQKPSGLVIGPEPTGWHMMLRDKLGQPYELGRIIDVDSYPTAGLAESNEWVYRIAPRPDVSVIIMERFSSWENIDPVMWAMGASTTFTRKCVIDTITPGDNDMVNITAHTYEPGVFNGTDPGDPGPEPVPEPEPPEAPGVPEGFPPNAPPGLPIPSSTGYHISLDESEVGDPEHDCHVSTPWVSFYADQPFSVTLIHSKWPVFWGPFLEGDPTPDPITGKYPSGRYKVALTYVRCPASEAPDPDAEPDTADVYIGYE